MPKKTSLSRKIERSLPAELLKLVRELAGLAVRKKLPLYLVGGVVRDLLLGRPNFDIDLVVEGDAVGLVKTLAASTGARLTVHERFGTAKLRFADYALDVATARAETYSRPGALPTVKPGSLGDDLFRRDFTVNAMAVRLWPEPSGELIDPYGGYEDLKAGLVRVLHERSFADDATRMWRAVRYEQRLGFHMEPVTIRLLRRDLPMLGTISGDRVRHELEMVLKEDYPEKMLARAWKLGVLGKVHPSLKGDEWLCRVFANARRLADAQTLVSLRWALLTHRMDQHELEDLIAFLHPDRRLVKVLRDTNRLKAELKPLARAGVKRSRIYSVLNGCEHASLLAHLAAARSRGVRSSIELYLEKLRLVRPALSGRDLLEMGLPAGPQVQEMLGRLLEARLEGQVTSRAGEVRLVRRLLG